jgi:hypothetical protein
MMNDWEELNFYETSPYLPDTDSDGTNDKTEIDSGTDPSCPKGQVCESGENLNNVSTVTSSDINSPLVEDIGTDGIISMIGASQLAGDTESAEYQEISEILNNPEKIRGLLVSQGGLTVSEAAQIPDDKLLQW